MLAWALGELGEHTAATEVGRRLERSARLAGPFACFAETCPLEGAPRATVHATALAVLALRKVLPRSAALAPAVRYLLATRGAGGFGEDVAGGLAALALARAGDVAPLRAGPVGVEANGRPVATLARLGQREETRLEIGSGPVVLSTTGQVAWRLEQTTASREAGGELEVTRTFQALDPSGKPSARPLQAGDRVRITLSVAAAAAPATWAVRVEDPYPAGLRPIDLEGEHEQFRKLSDRALRLFLPDRVVFLLPALAEGRTVLEWEAEAVVAGHFAAAPAVVHRGGQQGQSAPTPLDVAPPPLEPRTQAGSPP